MSGKTQDCQDANLPQVPLYIQVNSNKIPASFFVETDSFKKGHGESQNNFEKEQRGPRLLDFKTNIKSQ